MSSLRACVFAGFLVGAACAPTAEQYRLPPPGSPEDNALFGQLTASLGVARDSASHQSFAPISQLAPARLLMPTIRTATGTASLIPIPPDWMGAWIARGLIDGISRPQSDYAPAVHDTLLITLIHPTNAPDGRVTGGVHLEVPGNRQVPGPAPLSCGEELKFPLAPPTSNKHDWHISGPVLRLVC